MAGLHEFTKKCSPPFAPLSLIVRGGWLCLPGVAPPAQVFPFARAAWRRLLFLPALRRPADFSRASARSRPSCAGGNDGGVGSSRLPRFSRACATSLASPPAPAVVDGVLRSSAFLPIAPHSFVVHISCTESSPRIFPHGCLYVVLRYLVYLCVVFRFFLPSSPVVPEPTSTRYRSIM